MLDRYQDMLDLPRPPSPSHAPMRRRDRAAQCIKRQNRSGNAGFSKAAHLNVRGHIRHNRVAKRAPDKQNCDIQPDSVLDLHLFVSILYLRRGLCTLRLFQAEQHQQQRNHVNQERLPQADVCQPTGNDLQQNAATATDNRADKHHDEGADQRRKRRDHFTAVNPGTGR